MSVRKKMTIYFWVCIALLSPQVFAAGMFFGNT